MDKLLLELRKDFPGLDFASGEAFCWSPKTNTVMYNDRGQEEADGWALLHEVGHAVLNHHNYSSDLELISLESKAWAEAKRLGEKYGHTIDPDHIEDCMDTYRDWLHQRSACPTCDTRSLQQDASHYRCHNCGQIWAVTASRFCRPYRRKQYQTKTSPQSVTTEAMFV